MIEVLNTLAPVQLGALLAMSDRATTAHEVGVQGSTMWALEQRGLVEADREDSPVLYYLSNLGQSALAYLTSEPEPFECERPIARIQREVAAYYHIPILEMVSARRARAVARPRQVAMYLAKLLTTKSLPDIGKRFGNRDHTTVIHAVRQIENLMMAIPQLRSEVEFLRDKLHAEIGGVIIPEEPTEQEVAKDAAQGSAKLLSAMLAMAA